MIRSALTVLAVGGLAIGGWVIAGENCHKNATAAKGEGGCCKQLSAEAQKALAENAAWKQADELLKSWGEAPARLVAMTDADKAELKAAAEKMSAHPAANVMKPSVEYVRNALKTAVKIDRTAREQCEAACKAKAAQASAEKIEGQTEPAKLTAAGEEKMCPKVKAAKLRMEQSAALIAKASYLISIASKTGEGCASKAGVEGCASKAGVTKTALKEDADGGCPKAKAAKLAAAAASQPAALMVKATDGEKGTCAKSAAMAEGKSHCPKELAARAEALTAESGKILAQWQTSGITLASMDESGRSSAESAVTAVLAKCPAGRLMPQTLATARDLLVEASKLTTCKSECAKDAKMQIPAEMKELMQARKLLISAAINVLDRTTSVVKAPKQIASAQ